MTAPEIVIQDATNQLRPPSAHTLRPEINYGPERHRFGINSPGYLLRGYAGAEGTLSGLTGCGAGR
jgi:hypothetical protein